MKKLAFLLLLICELNLFGQTDSIERATLNNRLLSKGISENAYLIKRSQWNNQMKSSNYPDFPVDSTGNVHYVFFNGFKNFDKEKLFNRTLEWLSINYGIIPASYYSNLKDGKIILRNNLNLINNYSCSFTCVITIKDEKIKYELFSISYQAFYTGDYLNETPEKTINYNISDLYPIILKKQTEWNLSLSLFRSTNKLFKTEIQNLWDYILSYDYSNSF